MLDPNGPTLSTLTDAGGGHAAADLGRLDTAEIAARDCPISERTVKNVLHEVTTRLHLRNRAHAVGYVMRHGLI